MNNLMGAMGKMTEPLIKAVIDTISDDPEEFKDVLKLFATFINTNKDK